MAHRLDLEEQEQLDRLRHFWKYWGKRISGALIVLALGLLGWNGYQYWQNRQAGQAAALLDALELAARSGDQARMEQAFADLQSGHARSAQAARAGLLLAKVLQDADKADGARQALAWVAQQSADEGLAALARLRLASVLIDEKNYDEALAQLSGGFAPEFAAMVADRRGDIFFLQDQRAQAIAEYGKAYQGFADNAEYRRLVEIKLDALGAAPQSAPTQAKPA